MNPVINDDKVSGRTSPSIGVDNLTVPESVIDVESFCDLTTPDEIYMKQVEDAWRAEYKQKLFKNVLGDK